MNIYEKLQTMRVALQETKLTKSGRNKFSGYDYFELADFLPKINELMLANKTTSTLSYGAEIATLTLIDSEKPEDKIEFTSPMSTAQLKGCHEVQNLGAVQTYIRRYLYITAFEIVESEILEKVHMKTEEIKKVVANAEKVYNQEFKPKVYGQQL